MMPSTLLLLSPLIIVTLTTVIAMLSIAVRRSHAAVASICALGLIGSVAAILYESAVFELPVTVTSLLAVDGLGLFFMAVFAVASLVVIGLAYDYLRRCNVEREELYILLMIATLGAMVLTSAVHFVSFFLGLEMLSVALYAMIGYRRTRIEALEAGIKYLLVAGASSAFLLFGMALIYAQIGRMDFGAVWLLVHAEPGSAGLVVYAGLAMIFAGIGFKLAVVPFHMWTPDVYQGASAPVAAYIATVSKGAVVAVLLRLIAASNTVTGDPLWLSIAVIAALSMLGGNLLALRQSNVKRLLAYSSIAHLGYLLVALLADGSVGSAAVTFYIVTYFATSLTAFGVVSVLSSRERDAENISDYLGLYRRHPWLALALSASLLSLAGIPLTAGFVGKFYIMAAGVNSHLWTLLVILVLGSGIGLFYYLRVLIAMFTDAEDTESNESPALGIFASLAVAASTLVVIWFGLYPEPLLRLIHQVIHI